LGKSLAGEERPSTNASRLTALRDNLYAETILAGFVGQIAIAVSGVCSARALGVEDRGHLALLMLVPLILVQLGGMGVPSAVTFTVARAGSTEALPRRLPALVGAQALAVLVTSAVLFVVLAVDDESAVRAAAVACVFAGPGWLVTIYALAVLQGQRRFRAYNALRLVAPLFYALAALTLVIVGVGSLQLFALVWVLTWPLSAFASVIVLRGSRAPRHEGGVGALVGFGVRALPGTASPLETFRLDQAVVGLLLSAIDLGLYVVAVAFTTLPRLLGLSIGAIAYPRVAAVGVDEGAAIGRRAVLLTLGLCLVVVGPLVLAAPFLIQLVFGEEFAGASACTRILLVGALFSTLRRLIGDVARGLGRPSVGSIGEIVSWVSALPLLAVLMPLYGLEGVAVALSSAAALSFALVLVLMRMSRQ
jgi:O-antigen/teichoic acid export membrane protein